MPLVIEEDTKWMYPPGFLRTGLESKKSLATAWINVAATGIMIPPEIVARVTSPAPPSATTTAVSSTTNGTRGPSSSSSSSSSSAPIVDEKEVKRAWREPVVGRVIPAGQPIDPSRIYRPRTSPLPTTTGTAMSLSSSSSTSMSGGPSQVAPESTMSSRAQLSSLHTAHPLIHISLPSKYCDYCLGQPTSWSCIADNFDLCQRCMDQTGADPASSSTTTISSSTSSSTNVDPNGIPIAPPVGNDLLVALATPPSLY
jgi:hypothetical protein